MSKHDTMQTSHIKRNQETGMFFDDRTTVQVEMTRSMHNRKPYRTKMQRIEARQAKKVDGRYVSDAPVSYHKPPKV